MPRDLLYETKKPDLTKPSMEALAYVLRHPETWPPNHLWDYRYASKVYADKDEFAFHCGTVGCAVGIAYELWDWQECHKLGISILGHSDIFANGGRDVTPTMVADRIDAMLRARVS